MRKIIFLAMIICFISCNERVDEYLVENTLQDTKWKIDYLLCLDETRERYELTAKNDTLEFDYGNFVLFSKNKTFESYYTAWCGNDCFRTVYGKYNIIFDTKLSITVDSVYYSGWCTGSYSDSTWTEYRKKKLIYFIISKEDSTLILVLNK